MTCPDCGEPLTISADQGRCAFADEPGHGAQAWWECPNGHSWEDEELARA